MTKFRFPGVGKVALGMGLGLAIGAAGGAGAVSLTRPGVEMAPTVATPVNRLSASDGVVTVKGRVAEVYGDRFVVQDATGRAMVDAGRDTAPAKGQAVQVQGRYDNGQLRASYLVDPAGKVTAVGPDPRHGPHGPGRDGPRGPKGPGGPGGPGPDGRGPDPRLAAGGPPCAAGAVPPPPPPAAVAGVTPPTPVAAPAAPAQ
ncbi:MULTISPECIES: hypothetical protein [unclassified Sphingomonas]|uniref:hypothetical protein n=1 Tax=unclassified Sphingomonas TaxID=196159 RepID=UPI0009E7E381|nr:MULTISPECIES: hypothetical protein [unclassified Sphingomonas]